MSKLNTLYKRSNDKIINKKKWSGSGHGKASESANPLRIVTFLVTLAAFIVVVQSFRWQIVYADKFKNLSSNQYTSTSTQDVKRGSILTKDGTVLAVDKPIYNVYATLSLEEEEREIFFSHLDEFVAEVSGILNLEEDEVRKKLPNDFVYAPLAKGISADKKKALEEANIFGEGTEGFGLYFEGEEERIYPNGTLASHLLGFLGKNEKGETTGEYGVQGYYYGDLIGKEGYSYEEKDSSGNTILTSEYKVITARDGKNITLTIDANIQSKVEKILAERVKSVKAKSGSAIIMEPSTGRIIAMANYPDYDPSKYWRVSDSWILKNRAVSDAYEYGSVMKPITFAIGIESGFIDKNYICNDETGYLDLYEATGYADLIGRKVYTWNRLPNGTQTISDILKNSSNPCTAKAALSYDSKTFYDYLSRFGISQYIGIGLEEEATNYLKSFDYWTKLDIITASFGQSITATPLQLISALSTFANNGVRMKPYIIDSISDDNETISTKPSVISTPVSEDTAHFIRDAMLEAVDNGLLGLLAGDLKNYSIAAKTGTAQAIDPENGGYKDDVTNDTVVGFAPAENPKIIMLVKMEEPHISYYASSTTVPAWREIFLSIADDLEIPTRN